MVEYQAVFKSKTVQFIAVIILAADVLFVIWINHSSLTAFRADIRSWAESQQQIFNLLVQEKATNMQLLATYLANDEENIELFYRGKNMLDNIHGNYDESLQEVRRKLYNRINPGWNEITLNYDVRQLQFHLGPGSTSYLRVHQPEMFGDNMDNVRHTIVDANTNKISTKGFETGRVYSGIRGVSPVYIETEEIKKTHIGALEAGTSFKETIKLVKNVFGSNVTILLRKEHVLNSMWPGFIVQHFTDKLTIDSFYIESSTSDAPKRFLSNSAAISLLKKETFQDVVHLDEVWQVCGFPLRDYKGSLDETLPAAGTVVMWENITEKWDEMAELNKKNIFFAIIVLIIVESILFIGWHYSQEHLRNIISSQTYKLEKLVNYDGLTKIYNRRAIENILQTELNRVNRYESLFTVMMFDLDHFKRINDNYGHNAGDDVLQKTAEIVQNIIRENDFAGRWGGEEFIVIAPETSKENGVLLAERMRQAIASQKHVANEQVTISVGLAVAVKNEKRDELVKRVDDALYLAKENGRNRIECAS